MVTVGEALLEGGSFEVSDYNWGLWITQLPCDGSRLLTAPTGCFQYFLESSGSLTSYNFQGGQYLNNQVFKDSKINNLFFLNKIQLHSYFKLT